MLRNKFGNVPTVIDNVRFHSAGEAARYVDLRTQLRTGVIADLELQPRFQLRGLNGGTVCTYVADFQYYDIAASRTVVEDFKGYSTKEYKLKAKLFRDNFGFSITEVRK